MTLEEKDFPTPEDISRELARERALNLADEAKTILDGGGSEEAMELLDEVMESLASNARQSLTGKGGLEMITMEETYDEMERWLENGDNPYPLLTMAESQEYLWLERSALLLNENEAKRKLYLQKKMLGRLEDEE